MNREEALDVALGQIERQFGKGSVMKMSDSAQVSIGAVSTGSLSLDLALGIGGLPRGRVVEIFGPESSGKTTLVYHVIAEAQRRGGICAFIDAEHAMDPMYAKNIGVNVDDLLVSQPDTGEQALEITELLVRSGALDVVAIDSVAALTPKAEIEGEMGDTHVGLQARLMSQALRKLAGTLNRTDTICLFTNQLREKIGVMFGCLPANTQVLLADGTSERIAKIVNQRLPVEVMSMDPETGAISPKRILNYFRNGQTDDWLRFEVEGRQGRHRFTCTPNHIVFTSEGERHAFEIEEGDEVLVGAKHYALSADQMQLILGGVLGDGSLRHASPHNVKFRVGHGMAQQEYLDWKHAFLAPFAHGVAPTGAGMGFDTVPMPQLKWLHDAVYRGNGGKHSATHEFAEALDERAIAVWYADDGTFSGSYERWGHGKAEICAKGFSREARELLGARCEELGMGLPTVTDRGLLFSGERTKLFHARIAPYVHPSLDYKLHPDLRGLFRWEPDRSDAHLNGTRLASRTTLRPLASRVLRKYSLPPAAHRRTRYDLEIEDSHTYLANNVVVHNSPETTPGGRALKFYASVRLDIRRIETLKDGAEAYGNRARVKVVKNKVAPPFKQAEFDIIYGSGISWEGTVLEVGIERKIVQKSGSYFSFGDERLGQGRQNASAFLKEHPDVVQQILARIQAEAPDSQIVSARLLPTALPAEAEAVDAELEEGELEDVAEPVTAA
ncbi:MAG: recombinase RecA [Actinobacteria bacterium]|nr:recombinase RecA [Actinomycetota bacterium]